MERYSGVSSDAQRGPSASYGGRTTAVTPGEAREIGQVTRVARTRPTGQFAPTAGGPSQIQAERGQLGPTTAPISVRQGLRADAAIDLARRGQLSPGSGPGGVEPWDARNIAEAVREGKLHTTDIEYGPRGPQIRLLDAEGKERDWAAPDLGGRNDGFFEENFPGLSWVAEKTQEHVLNPTIEGVGRAGEFVQDILDPSNASMTGPGGARIGGFAPSSPAAIPFKALQQVAEGFLYTPAAFYYLATDPKDTLRGMYEGTIYALRNPLERPGDILALVFGAKGLASGRVANLVNKARGQPTVNAMGKAQSWSDAFWQPGPFRDALLVGLPGRKELTTSWRSAKERAGYRQPQREAGALIAGLANAVGRPLPSAPRPRIPNPARADLPNIPKKVTNQPRIVRDKKIDKVQKAMVVKQQVLDDVNKRLEANTTKIADVQKRNATKIETIEKKLATLVEIRDRHAETVKGQPSGHHLRSKIRKLNEQIKAGRAQIATLKKQVPDDLTKERQSLRDKQALTRRQIIADKQAIAELRKESPGPVEIENPDWRRVYDEERTILNPAYPESPVMPLARRAQQLAENPPVGKLGPIGVMRGVNSIFKSLLLYSKATGYVLAQHPGLVFMMAMGLGVRAPVAIGKELGRLTVSRNKQVRRVLEELGGGGAGFVRSLDTGAGPFARLNAMNRWLGNFYQKFMDDIYRRAAAGYLLNHLGFKTDEDIIAFANEVLNNPNGQHAYAANWIRATTNEMFGNFSKMSDWERRFIADWVFFYPWIRASTRYAARVPLDHPVKFAVLESAGNYGSERALEEMVQFFEANGLGRKEAEIVATELRRMAPGIFMTSGSKDAGAVTPQQLSVLQGPSDFMEFGQGVWDDPLKSFLNFGSTPAVQLGGAIANYDTFSGHPYSKTKFPHWTDRVKDELVSLTPWTTMMRRMGWGFEEDQGKLYTYSKTQAIGAPTLSTAWPRGVNVQGVVDTVEGQREKAMPTGAKQAHEVMQVRETWLTEIKKAASQGVNLGLLQGDRLTPELRQAFNRQAEREAFKAAMLASLENRGEAEGGGGRTVDAERHLATQEFELLQKWGVILPEEARIWKEELRKADRKTIRDFREGELGVFWQDAYQRTLTETRQLLEEFGIEVPTYRGG